MDTEKISKKGFVRIISTVILTCVIASAVIGLGLLFRLLSLSDTLVSILLSLLTVFIAGLFLLNSINAVTAGNKFGIFVACMIIISAILFLLLIWMKNLGVVFNYVIVIVSMISILLNLITGHFIVLGKSLIAVQVFLYLSFAYVELVLSFLILGNAKLIEHWQIFVAAIIIAITLYVFLKVKEKNIAQREVETKANIKADEYVTITKQEYEELKVAALRLKEITAKNDSGDFN